MMATAHIILVGLHKEWLIASIKQQKILPDEHIILVLGEQVSPDEETALNIAQEIKSELGHLFEIKIVRVDKIDILRAAGQIIDLIIEERAYGMNIILNVSGSLRTFVIAAYIAGCLTQGCLTQVRILTAISNNVHSEGKVEMLKLVELPTLPIELPDKLPDKLPWRILNQINKGNATIRGIIQQLDQEPSDFSDEQGESSSENLDFNMNKQRGKYRGSKRSDKSRNERGHISHQRISHHLKNLEDDGFIQREGVEKEIKWQLTDRGKLVLKVRNEPRNERKPRRGYNWRKHLKK